ncbi:RHS repeat-associated core domain-containing protein [Methylosinus trichosporium]|uniref:RHS repeat-associated core domain-containing protein n=1 Tax=Methylosinus trichosporium TaxID=426 RepID=UPI0002EFCFC7|nr:RHS repeat-associated core domain-containing protein [Methylosinus trichosporium]
MSFIGCVVATALSLAIFFLPESVRAQANLGEGVTGWCVVTGGVSGPYLCLPTPDAACRAQWENSADPTHTPATRYIAAYPTGDPSLFQCDWTTYGDGRCNGGLNSCGFYSPGTAKFRCESGSHPNGRSQCVRDNEDAPPRDGGCGANSGGLPNNQRGNPVVLFDGAKVEHVTDFSTADNRFLIERHYRSIPQIYGVQAANGTIRGAIGGWRFGFELEVHLQGTGGNAVTLHLPNGVAYDFTRSGTQFVSTTGSNPQGDYTLAFVGTAPANWSSITGASTQWSVKDASNRIWLLQTFNVAVNNQQVVAYNVARPIKMTAPGGYVWNFSYDATTGALQSITDSYGRVFGFTWNFLVYPRATDPGQWVWFNQPVSVAQISLPGNQSLRYTYDPDVIAPGSSVLEVRRLVSAELLSASGTRVDLTTYQYENATYPDFLTGVTDARNVRYSTFAYDARGRAISTSHASDQDTYSILYNTPASTFPNELIRTVTNPLGKKAEYHWSHPANSNDSRETSVVGQASTNCPSSASSYSYGPNGSGFTDSQTDEEGRVTTFVRDSRARPTSITRGAGTPQASTTQVTWSNDYNLPTTIVEPGLTTTLTIDPTTGLVTQIAKKDTTTQTVPYSTNGQKRIWVFDYDATGNVTAVHGPLAGTGDTIRYDYTTSGALKRVTDEVGNITTATAWNALGQPTSITDANGVVTALDYDGRGRIKRISIDTANTPVVTTIEYSAVGDVTKIMQPNGVYEIYDYDNARRLKTITNSAGEKIGYTRDAMGNATKIAIAEASSTIDYRRTQMFDELGRLIKSIGAGSQTHSFGYDRTDNLTTVKDPRSNVFSYGFDALNRVLQEVDEDGATVNLTRNGQDDITAYKDARSLTTTYVRNGFGEVIQESSPDKGTTVYVRDARGLVSRKTDPRGVVIDYTYDDAGRLTAKSYLGNSAYWQTFSWDVTQTGNFGKGRLVGIYEEAGSNWRIFDRKGRIATDYRTNAPAPAVEVDYIYDAAGNIIGMVYPSGRRVAFSRDAAGRISSVITYQNAASAAQTLASSVTWAPFGPVTGIAFGNGLAASYTLDTDYRITRVQVGPSDNPGGTIDRSLSWTGETIDSIVDNLFPGTTPPGDYSAQTQSFTYTPTRRLKTASGYYGALSWSYDANGNRTGQTLNGVTSPYAYPTTSNRLASVTPPGGTVRNFTYDAAGNVLTDSRAGALGMTFEYDVEGRLSKARQTNSPGIGGTYRYDARSRLVSRTVTQTAAPTTFTTLYVHDINDHIIAETDTSGVTQREYIWLDDIPLAVVSDVASGSPVIYYVHADHLGRPVRMTAQNKARVWDVIYSPFGETSYIRTIPGTIDLRFPGQWFQLESGLAYNWHRHYDATLGRYVQPDPLRVDERWATTSEVPLSKSFRFRKSALGERLFKANTQLITHINYIDGPSIYNYARQMPIVSTDFTGLVAAAPYTPRPSSSIEQCYANDNKCSLNTGYELFVDGEYLTNCHYMCAGKRSFVQTWYGYKDCPQFATP